jgi:hypothetical protein
MDSCGSPGGDSSNKAFVIHYVRISVLVELFGSLPLTTFSHPPRGLERYCCSEVSGYSKPEPWLSSDLSEKP